MDTKTDDFDEQLKEIFRDELTKSIVSNAGERVGVKPPDVNISSTYVDLLDQRRKQKEELLKFVIRLTWVIVVSFMSLAIAKITLKAIFGQDFISDELLGTIAVSMFVETIAVVRGITKALWNERDVFSSSVMNNIIKNDRKKEL